MAVSPQERFLMDCLSRMVLAVKYLQTSPNLHKNINKSCVYLQEMPKVNYLDNKQMSLLGS